MTTSDIEAHIQDIYGITVSYSTVSRITDKILPIAKEWQQRPLEPIYAVVFLDAIHYHVRSEGQIVKKAVYIAIGVNLDGRKDVLGMWVGENESAKFWATVLNSLKNRGVEDIFIACTDNLTGFDAAIHVTFPQTEIQNCIIHQLRNSSKYVSYKDLKALTAEAIKELMPEKITYNITGERRKELVAAIANYTGEKAIYQNAPSFAYHIGTFAVDKNGTLTGPIDRSLIRWLKDEGFTTEE